MGDNESKERGTKRREERRANKKEMTGSRK